MKQQEQRAKQDSELREGSEALVSILIVNYNGSKWLRPCLESLSSVTYAQREVVVVDNNSIDDSLQVLAAFPSVKVVRSDRNRGFAGGNNLGLEHCLGKFVLLLNNDTVVAPDFLDVLKNYLHSHPEAGAVQGKMVLPRYGGTLDVCGSFLTRFGLPYHYGFYKPDGPKYDRNYPVFSGKGACLLLRRDVIPQVGGFLFEEDFFCYYEESDFCHRVWLAGYEVHFVPSPPVQHFMGGTAGGPQDFFVLRHYLRNMSFSLVSNLAFASRLRMLPCFYTVIAVSFLACLLRARWGSARAHWEALWLPLTKRKAVLQRRKLIQRIRKRTDSEVFSRILRNPRIDYFLKTFSGQLGKYEDEAV